MQEAGVAIYMGLGESELICRHPVLDRHAVRFCGWLARHVAALSKRLILVASGIVTVGSWLAFMLKVPTLYWSLLTGPIIAMVLLLRGDAGSSCAVIPADSAGMRADRLSLMSQASRVLAGPWLPFSARLCGGASGPGLLT